MAPLVAPKGIEDIDFPDICDKILKLLEAVCIFIAEQAQILWSYACVGFWTAWTWPPFEAFRHDFVAALIAVKDYVSTHPITAAAIFFLAYIVIPKTLIFLKATFLHCSGFRKPGVLRGSIAANYQSTGYGGNLPRGSAFSRYQSQGATGGNLYVYHSGGVGTPTWGR